MPGSSEWKVLGSRDVLDASPFLKVRVETIELPDGRCTPDYCQAGTKDGQVALVGKGRSYPILPVCSPASD